MIIFTKKNFRNTDTLVKSIRSFFFVDFFFYIDFISLLVNSKSICSSRCLILKNQIACSLLNFYYFN